MTSTSPVTRHDDRFIDEPDPEHGTGTGLRRVTFAYPDTPLLCWTPRMPEVSAAANSVSLMMPYLEPFVVRTIRRAIPDLDQDLATQARWLIDQENTHQHLHREFNKRLIAEAPALDRVGSAMRWFFRKFESRAPRSLALGLSAGAETVAFSIARWTERHAAELFVDADPVVTTLFMWHLAEEVEHKSVAFDVHRATGSSRVSYLLGSLSALVVLGLFTVMGSVTILWRQRRMRNPVTWWRLTRWAFSLCFELLPNVFAAAMKSHHPDQIADPTSLVAWLRLYDPSSGSLPQWWRPSSVPTHGGSIAQR